MTAPFDRSLNKSLRQLELAYQLLLSHQVMPGAQLQQSILGYEFLETDNPDSVDKTFERDKSDLRDLGLPLETRALFAASPDQADTGYRLEKGRVILAVPGADAGEAWAGLRAATSALQQVADALPAQPTKTAAEAALTLLAFKRDLGLHVGALTVAPALRNTSAFLLEWVNHLFIEVVRHGRATGRERLPISAKDAGALVGMPAELVLAVARRASDRPPQHRTHAMQKFRVELLEDSDEITVIAPRLDRPWRPRVSQVDALLSFAADIGVSLPDSAVVALRFFQR
jgi:hypothetical protein